MISFEVFVFFTIQGMMLSLLFIQSRFTLKKTFLIIAAALMLMLTADFVLYNRIGAERFLQLYPLTTHIPAMLILTFISRNRGWPLLFQLFSGVFFCLITQHFAGLIFYISGSQPWVLAAAYGVLTFLIIFLLLRFLRPLYLEVLHSLRHGWWLMCMMLAFHYLISIYLIPGYAGEALRPTVLKAAISLLMLGFYVVTFLLFFSVRQGMNAVYSADRLSLQLSALQSRMDAVRAAEESLRVERHDLRHRLQTAAELVMRGDRHNALSLIGDAQSRLDEQQPVHWCHPPMLDAVFCSYFNQAQRQGIRVDAQITLPRRLPAPEAELAITIANALENAVSACMALPEADRFIRCKALGRPGLMLEISNPCACPVLLDENGLPVSRQEGHGLGTRSIASFCKKYGALCCFENQERLFSLRIIF